MRLGWVLAVVGTVQFTVALDGSVANVALPAMRDALGFDDSALQWVINAYGLAFGGFLLLGGRFADLYGRRRVLVAGSALFGVASLVGGLAQEAVHLVVARAAQGLAAAALAPCALTILNTTFPPGVRRARALATWSACAAGGGAAGVLVGGLLTEFLSWRWVLLINVPIMAFPVLAARFVPREPAGTGGRRLDVVGAVLATSGLVVFALAVARTDQHGWLSAATVGAFAVAAVLLVGFVGYEARIARHPLVRWGILARRPVAGANLVMLLLCSGQYASFYFLSLHVQQIQHRGAAVAGLVFLPFSAGFAVSARLASRLVGRLGPRVLVGAGALVGAAGLLWFGLITPDGAYPVEILVPSLLASVGIGVCYVPLAAAATGDVPAEDAGLAAGLLNSSSQIGGSLGLAALVTVSTACATGLVERGEETRTAVDAGYARGLSVAGCLLVVAALCSLVLPGRRPTQVPAEVASEATEPPGAEPRQASEVS
ncbi:MFS transporter [Streptoalloteichus tenebrarius]|uniref:MFS transporter n=1 Tax=Streptoalloteichus tenebrarius (strain ATCC 17920 / DSM 40477 / JCM 4838 / CBS 697.72 / NBRC 16177 / NCIMB 11028 / NRRL B-12390 / A12253. 1 / ISP 5477) TaxID=1933 RepID=UPI0020A3A518|nr:MFS transporter [Streptoalloteichus tenebrarius]BFE99881.1 MFS transporter [Streptoalloteichus tenebrarius]